jgi:hypothetical protein
MNKITEKEKVFVITCPENGWDCLIGVYKVFDKETLCKNFMAERNIDKKQFDNQYCIFETNIIEII